MKFRSSTAPGGPGGRQGNGVTHLESAWSLRSARPSPPRNGPELVAACSAAGPSRSRRGGRMGRAVAADHCVPGLAWGNMVKRWRSPQTVLEKFRGGAPFYHHNPQVTSCGTNAEEIRQSWGPFSRRKKSKTAYTGPVNRAACRSRGDQLISLQERPFHSPEARLGACSIPLKEAVYEPTIAVQGNATPGDQRSRLWPKLAAKALLETSWRSAPVRGLGLQEAVVDGGRPWKKSGRPFGPGTEEKNGFATAPMLQFQKNNPTPNTKGCWKCSPNKLQIGLIGVIGVIELLEWIVSIVTILSVRAAGRSTLNLRPQADGCAWAESLRAAGVGFEAMRCAVAGGQGVQSRMIFESMGPGPCDR